MSDSLAIAAITTTLRNLLFSGLNQDVAGTTVTTRPPDKARAGQTGHQVNLFLYHMVAHSAWRNLDLPHRTRSGEQAAPHLPLRLYYLLTAYYGENEEDIDTADANRLLGSQRLLGRAIAILLDHPYLDPSVVQSGLPPQDQMEHPFNNLEKVRVTFESLSLEELNKLWSGFQTPYRLSAAFEVSVVLIESSRPARTPLPVLTIGVDNAGVSLRPDLSPPLPQLTAQQSPNGQPAIRLNQILTLSGNRLAADTVFTRWTHRLLEDPRDIAPLTAADRAITVRLPVAPDQWPGGVYTVAAVLQPSGGTEHITNALPVALAPEILGVSPNPATRQGDGSVTLTLTCRPLVQPGQTVALLIGDQLIVAPMVTTATDTLVVTVAHALLGEHFLRLRIDGVDSQLIDYSSDPPHFDTTQKVTITP